MAQTGLPATDLRAILQIFSAAGWHSWHGSTRRWNCPWEGSWMLAVHVGTHHQFWELHTNFSWLWAGAGYIAWTIISPGQMQIVCNDCHSHYTDPVLPDCLSRWTLTTSIDSPTSFLWLHCALDKSDLRLPFLSTLYRLWCFHWMHISASLTTDSDPCSR